MEYSSHMALFRIIFPMLFYEGVADVEKDSHYG
jgi:hypothetical protein